MSQAKEGATRHRRITLTRWAIVETEDGWRHFVGHCDDYDETRVSSSIVSFDVKALRGMSISGRIYQLCGPPGCDERRTGFMLSFTLSVTAPGD